MEEYIPKYNGWLNSNSFLKRAFAVYGHLIVASLIIAIPFYVLLLILSLIILAF